MINAKIEKLNILASSIASGLADIRTDFATLKAQLSVMESERLPRLPRLSKAKAELLPSDALRTIQMIEAKD